MSKTSASSSSPGRRPSATVTLVAGEVGAALGTGIGVLAAEGKAAGALLAGGGGALTEGEPAFACPTGA